MRNNNVKYLTLTAVYAAVIYIFTAYLHIPHWTGYVHVGAGVADILSGYALWAPGTIVIKALTAFCFTSKMDKILCRRNYIALLPSLVLCAGGYYLYESLITGNWAAPLAGIPGYLIQVLLSAVFYIIAGNSFDRMHLKEKILKNG